jgi:murein DD-endopeptidase MepM/ murein hydrolase activator NlpD
MKKIFQITGFMLATLLVSFAVPTFDAKGMSADEGWLWPVPSVHRVSSPMMRDRYNPATGNTSNHNGIDIPGNGREVVAARTGVVASIRHSDPNTSSGNGAYGAYVILKHADAYAVDGRTLYTLYAHLQAGSSVHNDGERIRIGDTVVQGQILGLTGSTGVGVTGAHLHFGAGTTLTREGDSTGVLGGFINVNPSGNTEIAAGGNYTAADIRQTVNNVAGLTYTFEATPVRLPDVPLPGAPLNFTAVILNRTSVQLSWNAGVNADRYEVEWRTGSNTFRTSVDYTNNRATSYVSYGMAQMTYTFRVRSVNAAGASEWVECTFDMRSFAPVVRPSAPNHLTAVKINNTDARISWNAVANATSYEVQWRTANSGGWRDSKDYSDNRAVSYVSRGMGSVIFTYRVRAVNAVGHSEWVELTLDMRR